LGRKGGEGIKKMSGWVRLAVLNCDPRRHSSVRPHLSVHLGEGEVGKCKEGKRKKNFWVAKRKQRKSNQLPGNERVVLDSNKIIGGELRSPNGVLRGDEKSKKTPTEKKGL